MLDETDLGIFRLLQKDGRMPTAEIARRLEVSEPTVRKKLVRMKEDGVIRVVAIADPAELGYGAPAYIGLDVDRPHIKSVARALSEYPNIYNVVVATGPYDVILEGAFKSMQDLYDFAMNDLTQYEAIKDSHSFIVLQRFKLAGFQSEGTKIADKRDGADDATQE